MANPRSLQNRWALVVGIDKYPLLHDANLDGCVRDAREMARALEERFGFPRSQMTVLLDDQATQTAILSALEMLIGKVGSEDAVVVHYSGHGSQRAVRADNRYEGDALEETLVPCDSGHSDPHENRDIGSAELRGWISKITETTPYVTLILDCCHSGTAARTDKKKPRRSGKIRQVLPDWRSPTSATRSQLRDMKGGPAEFARYVVLAACRNKECAYEVFEDGGHGAFTWHLLQELTGLPRGACPTYRDVFEPVAGRVHDLYMLQQPQLEGVRDRELFGLAELAPERFVPVVGRRADRVVLGAGATCGVREGALWKVYPPQWRDGGETVGRVQIVEVRGTTATARILEEEEPDAIVRWSRAVQVESGDADRFAVSLDLAAGELAERVRRSPLLGLAEPGEAAAARVLLTDGRWAVTGTSGQLLMARHRAGPGGDERVVEGLETWARFRSALGVRNDGSRLRGKVDFNVARLRDCIWRPMDDGEELIEGESVSFAVVNHHSEAVHVYVLDFGLTGGVSLLYPAQGVSDPVAPSRSIEIGTRPGDEIELFVPDELPYDGERRPGEVVGEEILKVFVTTGEQDLAPLFQSGTRSACRTTRGETNGGASLQALLQGALARDTRSNLGAGEGRSEDWVTFERRFCLKWRAKILR